MKLLNLTGRTIVSLGVIIILAAAVVWLVRGQALSPQTAQANTPTPVSTNTPLPTNTALPAATDTPAATSTPTPPPLVNFDTPAPGPTYTPAPPETPVQAMALVEPGQPVGGYSFGEARLVPGTQGSYIELVDWLPNEPGRLLIVRDRKSLEVIDVQTGETQLYNDGATRVDNPVWLPSRQAAAYLVSDEEDYTTQYLRINDGQKSETVFTTSWVTPLAVTPDGGDVILFDANWQLTQVGGGDIQTLKLASNTQAYVPPGYNHGELYQAAQAPDRSKAIYYNKDWLLLADFSEGKVTPLNLTSLRTEQMPPINEIRAAVWSSINEKVAFNIATGKIGSSSNLFIFDVRSKELDFVEDNLFFVGDVTWAPDAVHIMLYTSTRTHEVGYGIGSLFLVDTFSEEIYLVESLPDNVLISSIKGVLWSPDGSRIAVTFADKPNNPGLYSIDVSSQ